MNSEGSIGRWVGAQVRPLAAAWPGLQQLADWSCSVPGSMSDLVGFEVGLLPLDVPVAMHVRVRPGVSEIVDNVHGLSAAALSPLVGECGFVVEAQSARAVPTAVYASIRNDFRCDAASVKEVCSLIGADGAAATLQGLCRSWPVAYVGVMTARSGRPVRVVLTVPKTPGAWEELADQTGLDLAEPQRWALTWAATVFVNLDLVGGQFGPVVGIELKPAHGEDLFGWCARHDLDTDAILAWEGVGLFNEREAPFEAEDLARLYRGGEALVTHRRLNHIKVTCSSAGLTFKAYLAASRAAGRRVAAD